MPKYIVAILLLLTACKPKFNTVVEDHSETMLEDMIHNSLVHYASKSAYCPAQKLELVKSHEAETKNFVKALKKIKLPQEVGTMPTLNIEPFRKFAGEDSKSSEKPKVIMAVLRSDKFKQLLQDTAGVFDKLANDKNFTQGLQTILNTMSNDQKIHDKVHFIIKQLIEHPEQLEILIGAYKATQAEAPKRSEMTDLVYTPIALWEIGGAKFAGYGLAVANKLARPAEQVRRGWASISFENSKELIKATSEAIGQAPGLDGQVRNLSVVLQIFEIPKKPFLNLLYKLYTMIPENKCVGESLDHIAEKSVSRELKVLAKMTRDGNEGLAKMLAK